MTGNPIRVIIAVVTGIVAISTASIFIKLCDAHPLVIASYRLGLASLILAPIALRPRRCAKVLPGRWRLLFLTGLFLALHFTFWIASLKYTSVASSVVIVNINPVFVALGSYIILKERATKWMILGILLAITGGTVGYWSLRLHLLHPCGIGRSIGLGRCPDGLRISHGRP